MKNVSWFFRNLVLILFVLSLNTLNEAQSRSYMTGKVTTRTKSPTPVRSVWVILFEANIQRGRSITADDGKYYIGGLDDDKTYTIVVRRQITGNNIFKTQVSLPQNRFYNIQVVMNSGWTNNQ